MNIEKATYTSPLGHINEGLWHRTISVARDLHTAGKWDGEECITIIDPQSAHRCLSWDGVEALMEGVDYEFPNRLPTPEPSPHSTVSSLDENDFDAAFIAWALFAGFRMVGETFVMTRQRPNGRMSGWCMIWFVSDGQRHLCDCNGPNVRAAYVAAERQMRAVKAFGSLDNMKRYRLHQQKTARNTSGLHEDPEDTNPLEWCADDTTYENPYAVIDAADELAVSL